MAEVKVIPLSLIKKFNCKGN